MEWAYIFNTSTRREYGFFYLDLIKAFEERFFIDPEEVPIIAMCGSHGKSLAADVIFHNILKHRDPMALIDGNPVRHMYLESEPKEAIHRELFDHGHIALDQNSESGVSLMFVNQPTMPHDPSYYKKEADERENILAESLKDTFRRGRNGNVGGLIFASSYATFSHALMTVSTDGGVDNGWNLKNHDWEKEHTVFINSEKLQNSEKFQEGWGTLKMKYESRSVFECRM